MVPNHQKPSQQQGNITQRRSRHLKAPKIDHRSLILIETSTRYRSANRDDFWQNYFLVPNHQKPSQQQGNITQRWSRHLEVPKMELQNLINIGKQHMLKNLAMSQKPLSGQFSQNWFFAPNHQKQLWSHGNNTQT